MYMTQKNNEDILVGYQRITYSEFVLKQIVDNS
jgi:hypothetical protein